VSRYYRKLIIGVAIAVWLTGQIAPAGERSDALSTWDRFVSSIRAGKMQEAYQCFSPASRKILSYEEFCAQHHPALIGSEAILSPVDDGQFRIVGDWAQYRYLAATAAADLTELDTTTVETVRSSLQDGGDGTGIEKLSGEDSAGTVVSALLVREGGLWYLETPARQAVARTEAEVRNLLRRLGQSNGIAAAREKMRTLPDGLVSRIISDEMASPESDLCQRYFAFILQDGILQAVPRRDGLRGFRLMRSGDLMAMDAAGSEPSASSHRLVNSENPHSTALNMFSGKEHPSPATSVAMRTQEPSSIAQKPSPDNEISLPEPILGHSSSASIPIPEDWSSPRPSGTKIDDTASVTTKSGKQDDRKHLAEIDGRVIVHTQSVKTEGRVDTLAGDVSGAHNQVLLPPNLNTDSVDSAGTPEETAESAQESNEILRTVSAESLAPPALTFEKFVDEPSVDQAGAHDEKPVVKKEYNREPAADRKNVVVNADPFAGITDLKSVMPAPQLPEAVSHGKSKLVAEEAVKDNRSNTVQATRQKLDDGSFEPITVPGIVEATDL